MEEPLINVSALGLALCFLGGVWCLGIIAVAVRVSRRQLRLRPKSYREIHLWRL